MEGVSRSANIREIHKRLVEYEREQTVQEAAENWIGGSEAAERVLR